jgi:integrase
MALTVKQIDGLRPKERTYKVSDGNGLYLHITPSGGKLWRLKYRFSGKEKSLAIGSYPTVSLKHARDKTIIAKRQLADGIDPSAAKREQRLRKSKTFGVTAKEWYETQLDKWTPGHAQTVWRRLELNVLPWLKDRAIDDISTAEVLEVLRRIENRGAIETAHRVAQICSKVFMFAIASGLLENNPANGVSQALKVSTVKPMAAITEPKEIKALMEAIEAFQGSFIVRQALRTAPLVFVRPGELRHAEWSEIDFEENLWSIPGEKMKMKRPHIVPLSKQAIQILRELEPLTGSGLYVFPSIRTPARPMSENTINVALRRLGYDNTQMTGHGFRTMASTRLHEMGFHTDHIEMQLAHADKNSIRGTYNKALYLEPRKRMMQAWADYLYNLKNEEKVISFRRGEK